MTAYYRPLVQTDAARPQDALPLAGGWGWFTHVEVLHRDAPPRIANADILPPDVRDRLCTPRAPLAGLTLTDSPRLMGIVNVTPDSFSDGGQFLAAETAIAHGRQLRDQGADILDIGGESTRPGAVEVSVADEIARTAPVVSALAADTSVPVSIDTRKAAVAAQALAEGAALINDVSAMGFDPEMAATMARAAVPVCLMHAQGLPDTMQRDPRYGDALLDVYDALEAAILRAEAAGIPRARILADPGIGFGKTTAHNLDLLRGLSLFHGLGCALLIGVSRKRFIGEIGAAPEAADRVHGSIAVALAAVAQGAQIIRVHDVAATRQALSLHRAVTGPRETRQGAMP
ncbi:MULTISPECIES: dihydropteroate synthase [unclassified Meridianimarinicoccus]|uniref:dihydropteroate synthase n=1 Tax=unclassified Meridianimarinicoccus TaxID=2923344 RepID=UPI001867B795|nr:dihydropteroate synthase [Fluviibacterium sp. MJW13]